MSLSTKTRHIRSHARNVFFPLYECWGSQSIMQRLAKSEKTRTATEDKLKDIQEDLGKGDPRPPPPPPPPGSAPEKYIYLKTITPAIPLGNKILIAKRAAELEASLPAPSSSAAKSKKGESEEAAPGFVMYNGGMVDIQSIMQRLEKSEKTRTATEDKLKDIQEDLGKSHFYVNSVGLSINNCNDEPS